MTFQLYFFGYDLTQDQYEFTIYHKETGDLIATVKIRYDENDQVLASITSSFGEREKLLGASLIALHENLTVLDDTYADIFNRLDVIEFKA